MAATDIRLIVLATVRDLEPATGYAVRKRLIEQGIEAWGGVSVASIYSGLKTLTSQGALQQVADPTGVRQNTRAYRVTESGRREFGALWRRAIETVDPAHPLAFHVAITLTAFVTRDAYVTSLGRRLAILERAAGPPLAHAPAQVQNAAELWTRLATTEAQWIRQTIERAEEPDCDFGFARGQRPEDQLDLRDGGRSQA
jgi:DNA-binding PadR family transcriptional regulator